MSDNDNKVIITIDDDDDDTDEDDSIVLKKQRNESSSSSSTITKSSSNINNLSITIIDSDTEDEATTPSITPVFKKTTSTTTNNSSSPSNFVNKSLTQSIQPSNTQNKRTFTTFNSSSPSSTLSPLNFNKFQSTQQSIINNVKLLNNYNSNTFYLNSIKNQPNKLLNSPITLSIQDLFKEKGMTSAMICGFCFDVEWLYKLLYETQQRRVPITLIKHYQTNVDKKGTFPVNPTTMAIHPPLINYQIFHAKLMLLIYPDFIRVIIPSSNPTGDDYDYLNQTIWFQDFYKKSTILSSSSSSPTSSSPTSNNNNGEIGNDFLKTLKYFLTSMGCQSSKFLDDYDYSKVTVHLVISVPGYYTSKSTTSNDSKPLMGIYKLENILKKYYKEQDESTDYSEFENKNQHFVRDFYFQASSIGGDRGGFRSKFLNHISPSSEKNSSKPFHIVYPTKNWIFSSDQRIKYSGFVFLNNKNFNHDKSQFTTLSPKYEYRNNLIYHSKVLVGISTLLTSKSTKDSLSLYRSSENIKYDWIYTGSHNFSSAAWGTFQKNDTQIQISNFEIGVLFTNPIKSLNDCKTLPIWKEQIPFKIPEQFYEDNDIPWISENYNNGI